MFAKKAVTKAKTARAGGDKKRRRRRRESYAIYIYKVLDRLYYINRRAFLTLPHSILTD
jgi:hypothetical protein